LGKRLSEKIDCSFFDVDQIVEQLYRDEHGHSLSVRAIMALRGERAFRALEKRALLSLSIVKRSIIALGGGTLLNQDVFPLIKALGQLVYLKIEKDLLKKRMFLSGIPSFLDPSNLEESFENHYRERLPLYTSISAACIDVQNKEETILEELMALYRSGSGSIGILKAR